ncbi:kinase-like domain-containing protein [Crepidotus variabilis]|uniref:Kinase-like domain-containing protein n=1 Tax=Crepidotus variabilis TaxID=179855 RepID=A0A9P6EF45_9AGAR|nr:kinase-like domain-containing protein [Crepidotus variabilis]
MATSHLVDKSITKHSANRLPEVYTIIQAHSKTSNIRYLINDLPYHITPHTDVYSGLLRQPPDEAPRAVVIKVWRLSESSDQRKEFCSRCTHTTVAASIHPNIAHPLNIISSRLPALVLPRYEEDLLSHLHNLDETSLPNRLAITINMMAYVADALHFLHSRTPPIIHGGIHCSNILIYKADGSNTPIPVLTDIGLGDLPYPRDLTMFNSNENLKLLRWMAPELLFGQLDFDSEAMVKPSSPTTHSDIYSFGMTFLEALTGCHPFVEHRNIFTVVLKINNGARPSKPAIFSSDSLPPVASIFDDVWLFLRSCWVDDPLHRPTANISSRCIAELSVRAATPQLDI